MPLYLIPTTLGEQSPPVIPDYAIQTAGRLKHFVVEKAKTARAALKAMSYPHPLQEAVMIELNERTEEGELEAFLQVLLEGHSVGVLSEAGCPGVADPGARAVAWAHRQGVQVVPLVGPSSILLALMASGLNGQSFCFHGYLPQQKPELAQRLRKLEQQSTAQNQTQIFIETPYRNEALLEILLSTLRPATQICIAADLTLPSEFIRTKSAGEWKAQRPPSLHKRPAVFLMLSNT